MSSPKNKANRSAEEKARILEHFREYGVVKTSRHFGLSPNTLYKWRDKFEAHGLEGLQHKTKPDPFEQPYRKLLRENLQLKQIVAEKELALRIKDEMLKKSASRNGSAN